MSKYGIPTLSNVSMADTEPQQNQIKVLFTWHAAVTSGNQHYVRHLASYPDLEIHLLIPPRWDESVSMVETRIAENEGFNTVIGEVNNPFKGLSFTYKYARTYLQEIQPDIIFMYEEPYSSVAYQFVREKTRCCPQAKFIFCTWQNILCKYPLRRRLMERYVFKHTDVAVAGSADVRDVLLHRKYKGRISTIPLALDPSDFPQADRDSIRRELGITDFTLGFVGRPEEEKGITDLFDTVASLKKRRIQILFVGGGKNEDKIREYAESVGIADRLVWLKGVKNSEVYKYYQAMDVLVLPSRTTEHWKEQFGRVIIEAMICRTPVIGSSSGEIPRVVGETGLIFTEQNVRELKDAVIKMMDNDALRKELAGRGYERVMQNYTWEKVAELTHAAILDACGRT